MNEFQKPSPEEAAPTPEQISVRNQELKAGGARLFAAAEEIGMTPQRH